MIHQIILLIGLHILRRGEVDAILLAYIFGLFPGSGQAHEGGVEFGEVGAQHRGSVARRVAGDEDGAQGVGRAGLDDVDGFGHLVEFVWADVWTVAEAKVDLRKKSSFSMCSIERRNCEIGGRRKKD